jgi:microcystin-dependent protein
MATPGAPVGYLPCRGNAGAPNDYYTNPIYQQLRTLLGTTYGANGMLPDFRDCFLRGAGGTLGAAVGTKQLDAAPNIKTNTPIYVCSTFSSNDRQEVSGNTLNSTFMDRPWASNNGGGSEKYGVRNNLSINASNSSAAYGRANEVRPVNYSVYYYIKY